MNRRHVEAMKMAHPNGHDSIAGQPGHIYSADGRTQLAAEDLPSYRAMQGEEFDGYTNWTGSDERTRRAYSISARTVRGPSGERLGAAVAYQEVTDLMRAMQVKDDFVASVSHELRTPLTSVLGYLEILADNGSLPQDVRAQVQVVRRNALRLQSLVSDLLEVGEFAETGLTLQRETVDVARIAREAVEAAGPLADRATVALAADLPEWLVALVDEARIRQVLDNLLSNGVKYSGAGQDVRLVLRQVGATLEIEVGDTGMGIAEHEVPHIFDRFYRGAAARSDQIAGTGLGLDIVRTIVEAHGGAITVDSVLGEGTTFRVSLPVGI
jgi:signal transduction histidine kinase